MKADPITMKTKLILLVALAVVAMSLTSVASAGELVGARQVLGFASTFSDTFTVEIPLGERAFKLPSAYMFWSEDGSKFYIQRWFGPTGADMEASPFPIPANSSLTIPAPPAVVIDNLYRHVFYLNATTVTDSVFCLPLDR